MSQPTMSQGLSGSGVAWCTPLPEPRAAAQHPWPEALVDFPQVWTSKSLSSHPREGINCSQNGSIQCKFQACCS